MAEHQNLRPEEQRNQPPGHSGEEQANKTDVELQPDLGEALAAEYAQE
jgi:hypothetical protein